MIELARKVVLREIWLFTPDGFYSIVTSDEFGEEVQVSAKTGAKAIPYVQLMLGSSLSPDGINPARPLWEHLDERTHP